MNKTLFKILVFALFMILPLNLHAATTEEIEMSGLINEGETVEEIQMQKSSAASYNRKYDDALKADIIAHKTIIDVSGYGFNDSNVQKEITDFINRNPEIFFLGDNFRVTKDSSGNITKILFAYTYDKDTTARMLSEIDEETEWFLKEINGKNLTDAEKVLLTHDYVCRHCEYSSSGENAYNLYGAMAERKAVCQGYCQMEEYLLGKLGITAGVATSMNLEHAWTVVKIGGNWYHSDPTFDDQSDYPGGAAHDYVLISTNTLYENDEDKQRSDFMTTIPNSSESFSDPADTSYENMFWKNSQSNIISVNGKFYYSGVNPEAIIEVSNGKENVILETDSFEWEHMSQSKSYTCLGYWNGGIVFAGPHAVYRFDPSTKKRETLMHSEKEIIGVNVCHDEIEYMVTEDDSHYVWDGKTDQHQYELIEEKEATLTEEGYQKYSCICGEEKTEVIPRTNDISSSEIIFSENPIEFNGGETKPSVTVKLNGKTLSSDAYSLTFRNADKIGTATVTATAKGSYKGSVSANYEIVHTSHSYDSGTITKAATCTNAGIKTYTCTICGNKKESRTLALGHDYKETDRKEATCTEDGYILSKCSRCQGEKKKTLTALGHDPKTVGAISPTATKEGYTGDIVCTRCNETISKGSVIPATGHHLDNGRIIKEPTCTEEGIIQYKCTDSGCQYTKNVAISVTEHVKTTSGAKSATCEQDGYTGDVICSECKKVLQKGKTIEKKGHNFTQKGKEDATCQKDGYILSECKTCKKETKKIIPATGHQYDLNKTSSTKKYSGYRIVTTTSFNKCRHCGTIADKKKKDSVAVNTIKLSSVKRKKGKSTAKWKKSKGISEYQIQYSKKKSMKSAETKTLKKQKITVKGKYYFRIRNVKKIKGKKYYSKWSAVR